MYAVTVTLQVKSGMIQTFMPLMIKNAHTSRREEPGCQMFDVCRDENTIFLYEIYDDRAAFDAHLTSDHFQAFDTAVADMVIDKQLRLFDEVTR